MANNNDWLINLVGSLDPNKTKKQIDDDIKDIQQGLKKIELQAKLDSSVLSDLKRQLDNLHVELSNVTISQTALNNLVGQINNALQGIQIPNINFNPSGVGNFGRQVGELVSDKVNNALGKITSPEIGVRFTVEETDSIEFNRAVNEEIRKLQKLNNKMVSVRYTTNTEQRPVTDVWGNATGDYEHVEKLTGAVFRYNTETGEAITKTMKWAQIGTTVDDKGNDIPLMGWVQGLTSYNKSLEEATVKTDTFLDKQKQAVATAESKLSKIESELNDKNAPKTLANTDKVANGLNKALQDVRDQIALLGNASRDTFAQAKIDTDTQIVALENLIKRLKNAEYVATSLRTKTFDTVKKDEINNFEPLYQELLKSTAVDKDGVTFSTRAENLHNNILGATSSDEITTFLNNLSNLKTEYRAVRKQADDTAKATGLLTKKSEALSSLHIFRTANPDVEKFQASVGGATLAVLDLENAINNASSPAELNAAKEQMRAFERAAEDAGKATKNTATEYETLLKKANEAISTNKYSGSTSQVKTNYEKLDDSLIDDSLRTDYAQLISLSESLNSSMSNDDKVSTYKELEKLLPSVRNRITELSSAQKDLDKVNEIQHLSDTGHFARQVSDISVEYNKLSSVTKDLKTDFTRLNELQEILKNPQVDDSNYREFNTLIEKLKNNMHVLANEQKQAGTYDLSSLADPKKITALSEDVLKFMQSNTKMSRQYKKDFSGIFDKLQQDSNLTKKEIIELEREIKKLKLSVRNADQMGFSFVDKMKNAFVKFSEWGFATGLVSDLWSGIRTGISTVADLDTALVDLKKTANMSKQELEDFYYAANDVAKQMGVTTKEIIDQASAWSRLGFNTAEAATQMAKLSSQFKLISPGMTSDEAVSGLVSVMKAYGLDVEDVLDGIMSKVNVVGNKFALSNSDIIAMLQDSVSAMAEGNNTLEETIALETAAFEIAQDRSVGNGFKTVALRLRGINEETMELDDSLKTIKGDLYDITGVSVMEDADTYKSTYQILKDMDEIWDDLSDKKQAEALEMMFGKQRANVGAAVLQNFEAAEKAMEEMAKSAGNAEAEMAVAMDSVGYKLNELGETGTAVAQNLFSREDMKAVLDVINTLGNAVEWLTDKLGLFGSIAFGGGIFAGIKNVG